MSNLHTRMEQIEAFFYSKIMIQLQLNTKQCESYLVFRANTGILIGKKKKYFLNNLYI